MAASVQGTYNSADNYTSADPTIAFTGTVVAGDVLILVSTQGSSVPALGDVTAISGAGATWTKTTFTQTFGTIFGSVWIGEGATSNGTITATAVADTNGRGLQLYHLRGVAPVVRAKQGTNGSIPEVASPGNVVIAFGNSGTSGTQLSAFTPASGWTPATEVVVTAGTRYANSSSIIPTTTDTSYAATSSREIFLIVAGSAKRTNHVVNPSLEVDTTGWAARTNATIARSTADFLSGTASLLASRTTATTELTAMYGATSGAAANAYSIPVTPGKSVTVSAYVKNASGTASGYLKIFWMNAAGSFLSDSGAVVATSTNSSWQRIFRTATAPANAAKFGFGFYSSVASVSSVYLDNVQAEITTVGLGQYFDGSTDKAGFNYAWTGAAHASTSIEVPVGEPMVKGTNAWQNITSANSTLSGFSGTIATGDVLILAVAHSISSTSKPSSVSGCGATWTEIASAESVIQSWWIGTGATSSGDILATGISDSNGAAARLYHLRHVTSTVAGVTVTGSGTQTAPNQSAQLGQVVLGGGYSDTADNAITATTPGSGWEEQPVLSTTVAATRFVGHAYRVPLGAAETHNFSSTRASGDVFLSQIVVGDPVGVAALQSALGGAATLTSTFHRYINSNLTGSGTLTTGFTNYQEIASALGGAGTLTSELSSIRLMGSDLSGSATLTSTFHRYIRSSLSGTATLSSALSGGTPVANAIHSHFSAEGVLYSELFYTAPPAELGSTPLGKLVSFNVSTSAVPLNPAEGSGSTPSVNAGYIKGPDPEFALGDSNELTHGAVGTYEGEIVRLSLPEGSDVAPISQDTALTLLNNELHLFPFIDATPSVWTAARAIDYWSQQCGLFYDKVPGDCIAYASGFGHTDSYGAQNTARFYEKLTGGTTATTVLNGRSVKTLGTAVTGTTAFHELPKGNVAVSVPKSSKLVASIGLGIRGTGRTTTVTWNLIDAKIRAHTLTISTTSAGLITASIGGVPVTSATVAGNADYRVSFAIERASDTAVVGKLIVHTDDLAGTGTLVHESAATAASYALPTVAYLTSITHASAGGSGSQMLRWGTYLTVTDRHPRELPAVQKAFTATGKEFGFVSGFEGNVWALLNEYCAITRQDVSFLDSKLTLTPRIAGLSVPVGNFSRFSRDSERREKYKQVAVMNKHSKAIATDDAVLWRADSVFQVAAREVFETTVQTGHSILSLVQPVPVTGIWPFPYKQGGGQYVVTGADGYIIAPQWWLDNGGKVEVSLTGKEGEIAIKITAPIIDTIRAPYRISEGEADRPALYVAGSGILNDPKEVHVGTGASNAKEGFDQVFESPFISGVMETYDTAAAMAAEYSASTADVGFELPNDFYTPSRFGQYPAGTRFTDGKRNYRITDASQTHSKVSGNAVPHTTIGDYVASYPAGATLADEKARHAGRTIKQFNISPLKGN